MTGLSEYPKRQQFYYRALMSFERNFAITNVFGLRLLGS